MSRKKYKIDRREFLRGTVNSALSVSLGLPLLEMMFESDSLYAQAAELDVRYLHCFLEAGCTETTETGAQTWITPAGALPTNLPPLLDVLASVRDEISVIGGLKNPTLGLKELREGSRPTGANEHASGTIHALTGAPPRMMGVPNTGRESINNTIGRFLRAQGVVGSTGLVSAQSSMMRNIGFPDRGVVQAYSDSISWRADGQADENLVEPAELLKRFSLTSTSTCQTLTQVDLKQKSALDFVKARISRLMASAGAADRAVLDNYFQSFRETERLVNEGTSTQQCTDGTTGSLPTIKTYGSTHYSTPAIMDEKRLQMARVIAMGLASNKIRSIATMNNTELFVSSYGNFIAPSNYNSTQIPQIGMHSEVAHKLQDAYNRRIFLTFNRWQFNYPLLLINELKRLNILGKTLFTFGYSIRSADTHGHSGIPMFIAGGRDLGVNLGRNHALNDVDYKRVLRAILKKVGVPESQYPEGVRDDINTLAGASRGAAITDEQVYAKLFSR